MSYTFTYGLVFHKLYTNVIIYILATSKPLHASIPMKHLAYLNHSNDNKYNSIKNHSFA